MKYIWLAIILFATVCVSGSQTKQRNDCRKICCSEQIRENNRITTGSKNTRNDTDVSGCFQKCLAHDSGKRNKSYSRQQLCNNVSEIHFDRGKAQNDTQTPGCKYLSAGHQTNTFMSSPAVTKTTFHQEGNGTTNSYYANITWEPLNITDSSKIWTHYLIMWIIADKKELILRCQTVLKNQTFLVINSTWYRYPSPIEYSVYTYPVMRKNGYTVNFRASPLSPPSMERYSLPTEIVPEVTSSLMAAIIVGSCVGIAFFVAVAVAWKLNLRVHNIQDIYSLYWAGLGLGRRRNLTATISEQTIVEGEAQVYLSYFHEDDRFMSIVAGLVQVLTDEGYDVKMDKLYSTEMVEEGPERWAQKHIASSSKVVVLCSPNYIKICQQGKDAVMNGHPSEQSRVWFEVQLISHIYSKYKSASKIVCIWMNQVVPDGLPPWMGVTYKWPQDKVKILKRLKGPNRRSTTRESRASTSDSNRCSSLSAICEDDVFTL